MGVRHDGLHSVFDYSVILHNVRKEVFTMNCVFLLTLLSRTACGAIIPIIAKVFMWYEGN